MMLCEAVPTRAPNPGASWSEEDDEKLASLHLQQPEMPIEKISARLGRTPSAIVSASRAGCIRRIEGGKMRKCVRHEYCGTVIYSTWPGEHLCYSRRKFVREND